jgi:hypothetical protein
MQTYNNVEKIIFKLNTILNTEKVSVIIIYIFWKFGYNYIKFINYIKLILIYSNLN